IDEHGNRSSEIYESAICFYITEGVSDVTPPVITAISIDKNGLALVPEDTITLSFKADDESAIGSVFASFRYETNQSNFQVFGASSQTGTVTYNNLTGNYDAVLAISSNLKVYPGKWSLYTLEVFDVYNNSSYYYNYDLVWNDELKKYITPTKSDLGFLIAESGMDTTPPVISEISIDKNGETLKCSESFILSFKAEDETNINRIQVYLKNFALNADATLYNADINDGTLKFNIESGKYEIEYTVPNTMIIGEWCLASLFVYNENNIFSHYDNIETTFIPDLNKTIDTLKQNLTFNVFEDTNVTIASSVDGNGSINPSGYIAVEKNADQIFRIRANNGCIISDVKIDGISVGARNSYTFEDVTASHTIQAFFIPIPSENNNANGGNGGFFGGGGGGGGGGAPANSVTPTPIAPEESNMIEKTTNMSSSKDWEDFVTRLSKSDSDINELNITLEGTSVIPQTAIQQIQDINIDLNINLENGITWIIKGSSITNSSIGDIDLDIVTDATNISSLLLPSDTKDEASIQLSLKHNGNFGFEADVILPVNVEDAGKIATLYYYNPAVGKFEYLSSNKVSSDGTISIHFSHASDYVIVIGNKLHITPTLSKEISLNTNKETLYLGGTEVTNKLSVILPPSLTTALANGYVDYNVTYSSNKSSVASVSSTGVITAKSIGKATIITTVSIGDITTSFKTEINVKKAYFRFLSYENSMKIGDSMNFIFKANGYDISEISWYTTEKNIVNVGKNKGKLNVAVTAVSTGTDYLVVKLIDTKGKVYTEQIKIVVK
ncbi:MAG: hypothetical protein K0R46_3236, partial [Herbinix sp.]|nr:hypothetical protein [Herbinix sp.]